MGSACSLPGTLLSPPSYPDADERLPGNRREDGSNCQQPDDNTDCVHNASSQGFPFKTEMGKSSPAKVLGLKPAYVTSSALEALAACGLVVVTQREGEDLQKNDLLCHMIQGLETKSKFWGPALDRRLVQDALVPVVENPTVPVV